MLARLWQHCRGYIRLIVAALTLFTLIGGGVIILHPTSTTSPKKVYASGLVVNPNLTLLQPSFLPPGDGPNPPWPWPGADDCWVGGDCPSDFPIPDPLPPLEPTPPISDPSGGPVSSNDTVDDPCYVAEGTPGMSDGTLENTLIGMGGGDRGAPAASQTAPQCQIQTTPYPTPPNPIPWGAADVVFGDSYISGEGTEQYDSTYGNCDVSKNAWPALQHAQGQGNRSSVFENDACSGATTTDILAQVQKAKSIAIAAASTDAQSSLVKGGIGLATKYVQVSAGGNDLNFGPYLECALKADVTKPDTYVSGCIPSGDKDIYNPIGGIVHDKLSFEMVLGNLYKAIGDAGSPRMLIEVATYPLIFPVGGRTCKAAGLTKADQKLANAAYENVDSAIRDVVKVVRQQGYNIHTIDFDNVLEGMDICQSYGTSGVVSPLEGGMAGNLHAPYHPNILGHARMAEYVEHNFHDRYPTWTSGFMPPITDGSLVYNTGSGLNGVIAGGTMFPFSSLSEQSSLGYSNSGTQRIPENEFIVLGNDYGYGTWQLAPLKDPATGNVYNSIGGILHPAQSQSGAIVIPTEDLSWMPGYVATPFPPPTPTPRPTPTPPTNCGIIHCQ
jgi:GDSL-like Lipase/Acylhydrolase family